MQIVKFFNYTFFASEMLVGYFGCWHFNLIGTVQGQHKRVKKVITLLNAKIGLNLELSTVWTFTHRLPAHRYRYSSGVSIFSKYPSSEIANGFLGSKMLTQNESNAERANYILWNIPITKATQADYSSILHLF